MMAYELSESNQPIQTTDDNLTLKVQMRWTLSWLDVDQRNNNRWIEGFGDVRSQEKPSLRISIGLMCWYRIVIVTQCCPSVVTIST